MPLPLPLSPKESVGRQGRHFVYLPGPLSRERRFTGYIAKNTHRGKHRSGGAQENGDPQVLKLERAGKIWENKVFPRAWVRGIGGKLALGPEVPS